MGLVGTEGEQAVEAEVEVELDPICVLAEVMALQVMCPV